MFILFHIRFPLVVSFVFVYLIFLIFEVEHELPEKQNNLRINSKFTFFIIIL